MSQFTFHVTDCQKEKLKREEKQYFFSIRYDVCVLPRPWFHCPNNTLVLLTSMYFFKLENWIKVRCYN
jgi:hypothetical protein